MIQLRNSFSGDPFFKSRVLGILILDKNLIHFDTRKSFFFNQEGVELMMDASLLLAGRYSEWILIP